GSVTRALVPAFTIEVNCGKVGPEPPAPRSFSAPQCPNRISATPRSAPKACSDSSGHGRVGNYLHLDHSEKPRVPLSSQCPADWEKHKEPRHRHKRETLLQLPFLPPPAEKRRYPAEEEWVVPAKG